MADDHPAGERGVPVLDLAFDPGMLDALRAGVKAHARAAGLPETRAEDLAGALHGQVEDGEPLASAQQRLPSRPGHGLWLVRRIADRMRILSGARGTRATIAFDLPARRKGPGPAWG